MFMRSTYVDWIKELKWYDVAEERTGSMLTISPAPKRQLTSTLRLTSVLSAAICPMLL